MFLKPCEAETTKEGDSSKSEKAAEPTEVVNSSLNKRKAEFDPEEEESDGDVKQGSDDGKAEIEERDEDWIIKAPDWDVDSFDGLEYYSSPEGDLSSDEKPLPEEMDAIENYGIVKRQLIESKGFYMDTDRRLICLFKGMKPMSLDQIALRGRTFREYWEEMVFVCLKKHNEDKPKDLQVEFVEVVRGVYRGGARSRSYITFMAREKPDGPLVEYQAKAMVTLDGKRHPILCRPAPTTKP